MKRIPTYKTHLALAGMVIVLSLMSVFFAPRAQASTGYLSAQDLLQPSRAASGSSPSEGFLVGAVVGLALVCGVTIFVRTRGR